MHSPTASHFAAPASHSLMSSEHVVPVQPELQIQPPVFGLQIPWAHPDAQKPEVSLDFVIRTSLLLTLRRKTLGEQPFAVRLKSVAKQREIKIQQCQGVEHLKIRGTKDIVIGR